MRQKNIKDIAKQLGWDLEEVSEAVKKLEKEQSILIDWDNFFELCIKSKDPIERWINVYDRIYPIIFKFNQDELIELICKWIYKPDPLFDVWALFNLAFYKNNDGGLAIWLQTLQIEKSFTWLSDSALAYPNGIIFENKNLNSFGLCDEILSHIIWKKEVNNEFSVHSTLLKVISKTGFAAFNVGAFKTKCSLYSANPSRRSFSRSVAKTLMSVYTNSNETEKAYWLYFIFVEKLKELGFSPMQAYKEVAIKVDKSDYKITTIKSRYNERKKKFIEMKRTNRNYTVDKIIKDNKLEFIVRDYLKEYVDLRDVSKNVSK